MSRIAPTPYPPHFPMAGGGGWGMNRQFELRVAGRRPKSMNNPLAATKRKFPAVAVVILALAGVALVVVAGAFAVALWPAGGVDCAAMRAAIDQRNTARAECLVTLPPPMWAGKEQWQALHAKMPAELDRRKFAGRLREIPVGKCPQEFRVAWADYVERCRRAADYGLLRLAGDVGRTAGGDYGAIGQRLDNLDTDSAWYRVEAVAQKYGVDFGPAGANARSTGR